MVLISLQPVTVRVQSVGELKLSRCLLFSFD